MNDRLDRRPVDHDALVQTVDDGIRRGRRANSAMGDEVRADLVVETRCREVEEGSDLVELLGLYFGLNTKH